MRSPRAHLRLSLFSPRNAWTCLRPASDSDSGSVATSTSLLDNSSWAHTTDGRTSSIDDAELIALINGDVTTWHDDVTAAPGTGDGDGVQSWLHSRGWDMSETATPSVPASGLGSGPASGLRWSTFSGDEEYNLGGASSNDNDAASRLSAILAPQVSSDFYNSLSRGQATLDRFPILEAMHANDGGEETDSDEHLTLEFLDRILRSIEAQLQQGSEGLSSTGWPWQDLYHQPGPRTARRQTALCHPPGDPATDLPLITSRQIMRRPRREHRRDSDGADSAVDGTLAWPARGLGMAAAAGPTRVPLTGLFTNRGIYLPPSEADHAGRTPPGSALSSTRSTSSRGGPRPRQQNWYVYDPRLVGGGGRRVEPGVGPPAALVPPPAYDELMDSDNAPWGLGAGAADPPPPYQAILGEPPPTYDQSFHHMLAFDVHSIPVYNPFDLCNTLGSSHNSQYTDSDLLNDVNIDELLGTLTEQAAPASAADDACTSGQGSLPPGPTDVQAPHEACSSSPCPSQGALSTSRYPVGFSLGCRPPVRWSRSTAPDRWASRQNWALQPATSGHSTDP